MKRYFVSIFFLSFLFIFTTSLPSKEDKTESSLPQLSKETEECIECHKAVNPGIVEDWFKSKHSKTTPAIGLTKDVLERRISSNIIPDNLRSVAVGCYECHSQNPSLHKDNFEHVGYKINVIVSPNDCKTCHSQEVEQFSSSKKANAIDNLQKNPVFQSFIETAIGVKEIKDSKITHVKPSANTKNETCYACHGNQIIVKGIEDVPDLANWPNQGVGRLNPDGSYGACTACHPRHSFSIEIARKPYTCAQCHLEPDVPAWEVYKESKHGNIFLSKQHEWNWDNVPWRVGKDFRAPTCATCHNSLLISSDGETIVPRTHDFGERLWIRLFGLFYSHPQTKSGKTYLIENKDKLALPTTFTGDLASEYLIDSSEKIQRQTAMRGVCQACHSTNWANRHFAKLDSTSLEADKMVLAATKLLFEGWNKGLIDKSNPFDETLEQKWIKQWLIYANTVRYASAMSGPDYAAFKNGWWELSINLQEMFDSIDLKKKKEK